MKHNSHHGHFEAPREKKRLTGRQKGALGIVLALAVLIGLGVGIYKAVVRPPQKTEPVVETRPEAEEPKEPEENEEETQEQEPDSENRQRKRIR